jgi:hypothetical protein
MADDVETWHAARLIPVSGINGADEQERRGTSALLAVINSVREFGRGITTRFGAPAGQIETFIEVPLSLNGQRLYPDGLIRVTRGQKTWVALVEVKTGRNELQTQQLENYLDIAREQGFDAVITISNQLAAGPGEHPTTVDKRKIKKVALHHIAWSQIHTEAILHKLANSISDPDQAWILTELIRYLEHPKSGAIDFDDMGPSWVDVRNAVTTQTLRPGDAGARDVAAKWEQLMRFAGMSLGRQLGVEVPPALTRKEASEPGLRIQAQTQALVERGVLSGALKVPHTVGPLSVEADLRTGKVSCAVDIEAPQEGRPQTRVNWLLRQLADAPDSARVDTFTAYSRGATCSELVGKVRENPALLVDDQKRDIKSFRVTVSQTAGTKRGQGRGSFVASVVDATSAFYSTVIQQLKPWVPSAPKVRVPELAQVVEPEVPVALVSTALSSQDDERPPAATGSAKEFESAAAANGNEPFLADTDDVTGT